MYRTLWAWTNLFAFVILFIIYLITSLLTITSADARHRRRSNARPEIHRDLRHSTTGRHIGGQCRITSWDEVNIDTVPYPNATGSTVVDLTGRNTTW